MKTDEERIKRRKKKEKKKSKLNALVELIFTVSFYINCISAKIFFC